MVMGGMGRLDSPFSRSLSKEATKVGKKEKTPIPPQSTIPAEIKKNE